MHTIRRPWTTRTYVRFYRVPKYERTCPLPAHMQSCCVTWDLFLLACITGVIFFLLLAIAMNSHCRLRTISPLKQSTYVQVRPGYLVLGSHFRCQIMQIIYSAQLCAMQLFVAVHVRQPVRPMMKAARSRDIGHVMP